MMDAPTGSGPVVDWSPVKKGGTNFATHRLHQLSDDLVVFKPTKGAIAFYVLFMALGVGILVAAVLQAARGERFDPGLETFFITLMGLLFGGLGVWMFRFGSRPSNFDKMRGYFWKGKQDPERVWDTGELPEFAELEDIVGLQLLSERVKTDKGSYDSYELNLVLKDGSRINVTDHGKLERIREDSIALAQFLGVPMLDRPG